MKAPDCPLLMRQNRASIIVLIREYVEQEIRMQFLSAIHLRGGVGRQCHRDRILFLPSSDT